MYVDEPNSSMLNTSADIWVPPTNRSNTTMQLRKLPIWVISAPPSSSPLYPESQNLTKIKQIQVQSRHLNAHSLTHLNNSYNVKKVDGKVRHPGWMSQDHNVRVQSFRLPCRPFYDKNRTFSTWGIATWGVITFRNNTVCIISNSGLISFFANQALIIEVRYRNF